MYYYPYLLHLINGVLFTHYNTLNETQLNTPPLMKEIKLWSITRYRSFIRSEKNTFVASYHPYTKNYMFCGERYVSYEDVVNKAFTI
jgi:hypothetical protein